jgi:hypothetical protein
MAEGLAHLSAVGPALKLGCWGVRHCAAGPSCL